VTHGSPSRYRIVVRGRLSRRFADAFDGLSVEPGPQTTVLRGELRDATQVYGVLARLRDLGLELVSLEETAR
jgi:hypothetical protein